MAYDPMYEPIDENVFEFVGRHLYEWKYFYPDAQIMMPEYDLLFAMFHAWLESIQAFITIYLPSASGICLGIIY